MSEHLGEPEGRGQERPLVALHPVLGAMPVEEAVGVELLPDGIGGPQHALVVVVDEYHDRQAQQRGVEWLFAEDLDEHAALLLIAAALDRLADLVTCGPPFLLGRLPHAGLGQVEGALQRHPAEHLRVGEVPWACAPLPNAAVRLLPALGRGVGDVDDEAPVVVIRLVTALIPAPALLDQLAEDVELRLLGGLVPDPHRLRSAVSIESEVDLLLAALATDAVHDLQVLGIPSRAALDEAPEGVGLAVATEIAQRARGEGRVADPAVAVVPVALALLDLG